MRNQRAFHYFWSSTRINFAPNSIQYLSTILSGHLKTKNFISITFSKETSFQTVLHRINEIIVKAKAWIDANYLCLNTNKTQTLPIFNRNSVFQKMPFFSNVLSSFSSLQAPTLLPVTLRSSLLLSTLSSSFHYFNSFLRHSKILGAYFNSSFTLNDHFLDLKNTKILLPTRTTTRYTMKND